MADVPGDAKGAHHVLGEHVAGSFIDSRRRCTALNEDLDRGAAIAQRSFTLEELTLAGVVCARDGPVICDYRVGHSVEAAEQVGAAAHKLLSLGNEPRVPVCSILLGQRNQYPHCTVRIFSRAPFVAPPLTMDVIGT